MVLYTSADDIRHKYYIYVDPTENFEEVLLIPKIIIGVNLYKWVYYVRVYG